MGPPAVRRIGTVTAVPAVSVIVDAAPGALNARAAVSVTALVVLFMSIVLVVESTTMGASMPPTVRAVFALRLRSSKADMLFCTTMSSSWHVTVIASANAFTGASIKIWLAVLVMVSAPSAPVVSTFAVRSMALESTIPWPAFRSMARLDVTRDSILRVPASAASLISPSTTVSGDTVWPILMLPALAVTSIKPAPVARPVTIIGAANVSPMVTFVPAKIVIVFDALIAALELIASPPPSADHVVRATFPALEIIAASERIFAVVAVSVTSLVAVIGAVAASVMPKNANIDMPFADAVAAALEVMFPNTLVMLIASVSARRTASDKMSLSAVIVIIPVTDSTVPAVEMPPARLVSDTPPVAEKRSAKTVVVIPVFPTNAMPVLDLISS